MLSNPIPKSIYMTDFKVRVQFDGQFFFQTNYPKITKITPQNIFLGLINNKQL